MKCIKFIFSKSFLTRNTHEDREDRNQNIQRQYCYTSLFGHFAEFHKLSKFFYGTETDFKLLFKICEFIIDCDCSKHPFDCNSDFRHALIKNGHLWGKRYIPNNLVPRVLSFPSPGARERPWKTLVTCLPESGR